MQNYRCFAWYRSPVLLVILFFSCSQKSNNSDTIKEMEESLIRSNQVINMGTTTNLKALNEKMTDWPSMERAKIWYPKAVHVAKLSQELFDYIENIKKEIATRKPAADSLYNKLLKYKQDILITDSSITAEFREHFSFVKTISENLSSGKLTALQNNIKVTENKIITFCNMKTGINYDGFTVYSPMIGQSSSYLKPGGELKIQAGIGWFSKAAQPKIVFNGNPVEIGEEGFALYKMKVSKVPGNYKVPVKISFFNQGTGREEIREINVEYTVAKDCDQ